MARSYLPKPHVLPRRLQAALSLYCAERREQEADVIADAVALFLDRRGPMFTEEEVAAFLGSGFTVSPAGAPAEKPETAGEVA